MFVAAVIFVTAFVFVGNDNKAFAAGNLFNVDSDTISLWRFNDVSGSTVIDEMGRNNGTAIGTSIVDGKFGKARYFSGSGDYIEVQDSASLKNLNQITLESWVYPVGFDLGCWNGQEYIVGKGEGDDYKNSYSLRIYRNQDGGCAGASSLNQIRFNGIFGSASAGNSAWHDPSRWYYVVLTYDRSYVRLYVNGNLEATSNYHPDLVVANNLSLFMNRHTWSGGYSTSRMQGLIDEVRISNVARSAQEIANYYNLANGINQPPTISSLAQFKGNGVTALNEGSSMPQNAVVLGATVNSSSTSQLQLQVQLSTSTTFSSFLTATSTFVSSGTFATTTFQNLVDGRYYWRAKVVDSSGLESAWQEFGVAGVSDFTVRVLEPIVIIPGIMGSRLNKVSDGAEVWPNVQKMADSKTDSYLDVLKLSNFGQQIFGQGINASDVIRVATGTYFGFSFDEPFYAPLINSLVSEGYVEGQNIFVAPYDWRLSVASSSENIASVVSNAISHSPNGKINIIAHSMGGLVVKQYLSHAPSVSFLDKLVLAGVPQLGSPKMFKALQYGDDLDFGYGPIKILNPNEVKSISQNMPGAYDLLPSRRYVDQIEGSYVLDGRNGGANALSYDATRQFMTSNSSDSRNNLLIGRSDAFHTNLDNNSINAPMVYNLVGCQNPTIKKFAIYDNGVVDVVRGNGDKTVPIDSAMNLANNFNNYFFLNSIRGVDHTELVSNAESVQFIKSLIQNTPVLQSGISTSTQDCFTGFHESYFEISTHSPVALHAYDSQNRHTGPNAAGDADLQIPGSSYETIGENSFILLPASDTYRIQGNGLSSGAFTLKVKRYDEGVNLLRGTTYVQVPLASASTTASLTVSSSTPDMPLSLDLNGDGTVDNVIQPTAVLFGQSASDITPPIVTISSPTSTDYLRSQILPINIIATDTESGVAMTKAKLDDISIASTSIDLFFQKLGSHKLSAIAFDGAGNPASTSTAFRIIATPSSVISDINRAYSLRWITKKDVKNDLIEKIQEATKLGEDDREPEERLIKRGEDEREEKGEREREVGKTLTKLLKEIELKHKKGQINDLGYNLLMEDIKWLIDYVAF